MTAEIIPMPVRPIRALDEHEQQLLSRALEAWAYRARTEGRELDQVGKRDEAHAFYRMADQAQEMLDTLGWLRVAR